MTLNVAKFDYEVKGRGKEGRLLRVELDQLHWQKLVSLWPHACPDGRRGRV